MKWEDKSGYILVGIICFGLIFWIIIMPIAVTYGIISGKLDIKTLEPISVQEQTIDESMIERVGGY